MGITEFRNKKFSFKIDDGIVYCDLLTEFVDYDLVNEGVKKRLEIYDDNLYPMISDISKLKSLTKEARQRLAEKDGLIGLTALAIISKTRLHVFISNVYHQIFKVSIPVKNFTCKEEAVKWTQKYRLQR